ncbi:MAG: hypothetical protein IT445_06425 [Phycisphaeraceae bacterium]|nr:hypothetical protein [Phycisphaeraceae bacterium]
MSKQFWVNNWRRGRVQMSLLMVIVPLTLVLLACNFWYVMHARAQAQPPEVGVDMYIKVQELRRDLALTNEDLAALGLNREQAETVLQTLVSWCESHQAELAAQQTAERSDRQALSEVQRQINIGPRNEQVVQQLPGIQAQVASARDLRKQLLAAAGSAVESQFDTDQQRVWAVAKGNIPTSSQLRYVSELTGQQRAEIMDLARRAARGQTTETLASAGILTLTQQSQVQQAVSNQRLRMADVLLAEKAVLPVPPELAIKNVVNDRMEFE